VVDVVYAFKVKGLVVVYYVALGDVNVVYFGYARYVF